jgi:predicted ATPase
VYLGIYRLQGGRALERLFQVEYPEMKQRRFGPLRVEAGYAHQLPVQFTRFFGREDELTRLEEILLEEKPHLLTLTGPGGSGKTRLALEAARQLIEPFGGAVWFVPLQDLTDPGLLPGAIAASLRLPRLPQVEPLEQVVEVLSRQPSLLVLDNFEHLLGSGLMVNDSMVYGSTINHQPSAISLVRTLLERVPSLTLLITSRQVLNLTGEREFYVSPLPTPGGEDTPEWLLRCPSVQLFVDRAQKVRPDFQVTPANAPAVSELCYRLEGIPLALELAAARVQVLTPVQMLAQLEHRFDFLVSRKRDEARRHQTLRAAMDWSYQLLSPELQRFFARLSVFRGGWTLEAAAAVASDEWQVTSDESPITSHQSPVISNALDTLAQLQECSLVQAEEAGAEMRFRMLETLREYAGEQLASEEQAALRERHADYFLHWVEEAEPKL